MWIGQLPEGNGSWVPGTVICLAVLLGLIWTVRPINGDDPPISPNLQRAQAFVDREQFEKALPFVNASLREMRSPEALYLRGHVLLKLGRADAAEKDADSLIQHYESNWRGYYLRVRSLLQSGSLRDHRTELLKLLRNTLKFNPDHKKARVLLAQVFAAKGRTAPALDTFQQVIERTKRSVRAGRTAASVAFVEGKTELALDLAKAVLVMAPDDPVAARIQSFVENGVDRKAERRIRTFERQYRKWSPSKRRSELASLSKQFPETVHVLLFCGQTRLEIGDVERAMELVQRAMELDGDVWTAYTMGRVLEKKEAYLDAAGWYLNAAERWSSFGVARMRAGICFSRAGKYDRAVRAFRSVFEQVSIDQSASEQLITSCLEAGYLVFARERLSSLALTEEKKASFKKQLKKRLQKRRKKEENLMEDRVYRNSLYGIELSLPDHWSHVSDVGRPAVVAVFASTSSRDRLFIVAERRLPLFQDRSMTPGMVQTELREYLISKFLLRDTQLQFVRQRTWNDLDRQAVELVFRSDDGRQRMHCFVLFRKEWMLTFHYLARGKKDESRERMKEIIEQVIIHEE